MKWHYRANLPYFKNTLFSHKTFATTIAETSRRRNNIAKLSFRPVLLNLFDVAAHFSPRIWFWAHFTKTLLQNSWLGVIMAMKQSSHQLYRRVRVTRNHNLSSSLQNLKERVRPQAHLSASRTKKWSYWSVESAPTRPHVCNTWSPHLP